MAALSAKYLTLSQNDNYVLRLGRQCKITFLVGLLVSAISCIPIEWLSVAAYGLGGIFMWSKYLSSRTKMKFTVRSRPYVGIVFLLSALGAYLLCLVPDDLLFRFAEGVMTVATIFFVKTAEWTLNPFFKKKNDRFIKSVSKKFSERGTKLIAITGSFGKTCCKNILYTILSTEYNVKTTDGNRNTPMGVALSMGDLSGDEDYFIAEFGARREGDIRELCTYFPPDIGIITGVCEQHSEVFGSIHTIYNEKFSLAKMTKKSGFCAFGNNLYAKKMSREFDGEKISVGACEDIYAQNVCRAVGKTSFTLHIHADSQEVTSSLCGRQAIENILLCVAVANKIGVSSANIFKAIPLIQQIPHRLEYSYQNGVHILDDGYNGNTVGIKYALEYLSACPSPRIAVAQGVVEMGIKQKKENILIGRELSGCADVVFLLGVNKRALKKGLMEENFSGSVYSCRNLKQTMKLLKKKIRPGATVLFQNDLPDVY